MIEITDGQENTVQATQSSSAFVNHALSAWAYYQSHCSGDALILVFLQETAMESTRREAGLSAVPSVGIVTLHANNWEALMPTFLAVVALSVLFSPAAALFQWVIALNNCAITLPLPSPSTES